MRVLVRPLALILLAVTCLAACTKSTSTAKPVDKPKVSSSRAASSTPTSPPNSPGTTTGTVDDARLSLCRHLASGLDGDPVTYATKLAENLKTDAQAFDAVGDSTTSSRLVWLSSQVAIKPVGLLLFVGLAPGHSDATTKSIETLLSKLPGSPNVRSLQGGRALGTFLADGSLYAEVAQRLNQTPGVSGVSWSLTSIGNDDWKWIQPTCKPFLDSGALVVPTPTPTTTG